MFRSRSSFVLSSKKGKRAIVAPVVDRQAGRVSVYGEGLADRS